MTRRTASAGLFAEPRPERPLPRRVPALTPAELAVGLSRALDLAECQEPGHAHRLCYLAMTLARHLGLGDEGALALFYGALYHDLGVPLVSTLLTRELGLAEAPVFGPTNNEQPLHDPEEAAQQAAAHRRALVAHVREGAAMAPSLGLAQAAAEVILHHHERWDGTGIPGRAQGEGIPLAARIVALADFAERTIGGERSALAARYTVAGAVLALRGTWFDPHLTDEFTRLVRRDAFWLGYFDRHLPEILLEMKPPEQVRRSRRVTLEFAAAFSHVIDAKSDYTGGHSLRTANYVRELAQAAGLDREHSDLLWCAGALHDLGHLGVPSRVMAKADILTVEEMDQMREHPGYGRDVLAAIPGLEEVAAWVAMHHEWPDGKGYPDALTDEVIPPEAKIIAVCDVYDALTSERPYRETLGRQSALEILGHAAGSQLDARLVGLLAELVL